MKKERGITLVSLVVTIIILIILAGVSINLTLGKNGIITIAKQAKENTELAKIEEETALNELYMQIETEGASSGNISYDSIAKLTEFKTAIANYIEEAGGVKPEETADTATFGESIKRILKEATKDATATADDIAEGKTAYINGEKITGTNANSQGVTIGIWQKSTSQDGTLINEVVYNNNIVADNNDNKITLKKDGKISIYGCAELALAGGNLNIYLNDNIVYTYTSKDGYEYHVYIKNDIEVKKGDVIYVTTSGGKPGYHINANSTTALFQ